MEFIRFLLTNPRLDIAAAICLVFVTLLLAFAAIRHHVFVTRHVKYVLRYEYKKRGRQRKSRRETYWMHYSEPFHTGTADWTAMIQARHPARRDIHCVEVRIQRSKQLLGGFRTNSANR
jgi:hypothetical protein